MRRWVMGALLGALTFFLGGFLVGAFLLNDDEESPQTAAPTITPTPDPSSTPTPSPTPSPSPAPGSECSAAGIESTLTNQPGLPEDVLDTRARIWGAARACDFDTLDAIAREGGGRFSYSFGADDRPAPGEFASHLRREDQLFEAMRVMVLILERPYCTQRFAESEDDEVTVYAWPGIYCAEEPTAAQWKQLEGIYSPKLIRQNEGFGHYLLHRLGISEEGDWAFFIAGD